MPEIKVKHVVSFSSEDRGYEAENLLKPEGTSKWRCVSGGEKQVTCTLQFEKASRIAQIDIGNEGSAFIEVLCGRSSSQEDFQVILVASSFMSPAESRTGQNPNRVRIFSSDKLSKAVIDEKWDRVKVVCTQPFSKTSKYGLSFIKFHSPSDRSETTAATKTSLGGFKVKPTEPSTDLKAGSLFASRNKEKQESTGTPLSGAAAVRAASRQADSERGSETSHSRERTPSASPATAPAVPSTSTTPTAPKRKHSDDRSDNSGAPKAPKPSVQKRPSSASSADSDRSKKDDGGPTKKTKSVAGEEEHEGRPIEQLMRRVVFVMSGYQNPERRQIRDKAVHMGATYRQSWDDSCTHLICAFKNTPKYAEIKGRGRIVDKEWILKCHRKQKRLPWRKYRVGNARSPPGSSADEESADEQPLVKQRRSVEKPAARQTSQEKEAESRVADLPEAEKDDDIYSVSTDVSEDDIEIERDRAASAKTTHSTTGSESTRAGGSRAPPEVVELFGDTTDEDDNDGVLPELPSFFTDKHFFFYGSFNSNEKRTVNRYIIAYDGKVEDYMNEKVQFVLTTSTWDDNFDDALADNPNLTFVKPGWIYACNEKQKVVPHQKFIVIPT